MEVSEQLLCLYSAEIDERDGSYIIEVPKREITLGEIDPDGVYRVGLVESRSITQRSQSSQDETPSSEGPPVAEGNQRTVKIEGLGDQGDGIARVERGFVIIVPGTEKGDVVDVEIGNVRDNVAFGEVINHESSNKEP